MVIDSERIGSDKEYTEELRFRCITDHLFLAPFLGYDDFVPRIHRPVADFYVQKKPGLPIPEQDPVVKQRIHIHPRKTYKTSMKIVDDVQWILYDADITILQLSAGQKLAKAKTRLISNHFYCPKGSQKTAFHMAFPEHVVDKVYEQYWSPARTIHQIDATVDFTSPESKQAGWHPWVLDEDDMVETLNSGIDADPDQRQSLIRTYTTNKNTVRKGGYINIGGTRYHPLDAHGKRLLDIENNPSAWKSLVSGSLIVKNGERLTQGEFPAEDEVELLFPEILSYDELRGMFLEDYETFMCQQMNDPQGGAFLVFPEKIHQQAIVRQQQITPMGEVKICWRFQYAGKAYSARYSEGVAVRLMEGHAFIIDAWQGTYTPSGLAEKVVASCKKHQCGKLMLVSVPGAQAMEGTILNESYRRNVSLRIDWQEFDEDEHTMNSRIASLEPRMKAGRFSISEEMGQAREFKRQLVHFGLVVENGLVDCASRIAAAIPASMLREEIEDEELDMIRRQRERMAADMAYGHAASEQRAEEQRETEWMPEVNPWGLSPLPGGLCG